MKDIKNEIIQISERFIELSDGRLEENKVNEIKDYIKEKISDFNPVISIYGTYNSGKSTLLNALLGKEVASVGDSPETYQVQKYKWGDWTIFDTPGIDAPIEHEMETNEQIKKSECILFVISSDSNFEEEYIYKKIKDLAERNKPIIIVCNDKTNVLGSSNITDEAEILERVSENISKIAGSSEIYQLKNPEIIFVNAKSALKGKMENKGLLINSSLINDLENKILNLLKTRDEIDIINSLIDYFSEPISELRSAIEKETNNEELIEVKNKKNENVKLKKELTHEVIKTIRRDLDEFIDEVRFNKEKFNEEFFLKKMSEIQSNMAGVLVNKMEEINNQIKSSNVKLIENIQKKSLTENDYMKSEYLVSEKENNEIVEKLKVTTLETLKDSKKVETGITNLLKNIRDSKIKIGSKGKYILKGKWVKTFGKWAKKANYVIQIFLLGYEVYQGLKQQKEANNRIISEEKAYENKISRMKTELFNDLKSNALEGINEFFNKVNENLELIENDLIQTNKDLDEDLEKINTIEKRLILLKDI
ncbi:hypothetical protein C0585_01790 [Candidatus Woesearchaeota archaeon]|nr:MAG: hypothetical protein C0585_01790 [Candidatus Woesearchaeota archaeon]